MATLINQRAPAAPTSRFRIRLFHDVGSRILPNVGLKFGLSFYCMLYTDCPDGKTDAQITCSIW